MSIDPPTPSKRTVLIWHGNAGSAIHRFYYVRPLQESGFRVMLLEYPGYDAQPGELEGPSFIADALQAARRAKRAFGGPLYVWMHQMVADEMGPQAQVYEVHDLRRLSIPVRIAGIWRWTDPGTGTGSRTRS